ncbi:peroxiredoxin family protein [Halobacillus litoralis]|uniref:peroxiredoxin family protein n=1 Tax=Halobacillus litoralis TaxID=45668 RepID=UPI001CFD4DC6|nr:peroxiredoxin family protein [Halobacillus litoralis]
MQALQIGGQSPNFILPSVKGGTFSFENFRIHSENNWHVIVFFRGSWCPFCLKTLKELEKNRKQFKEHRVEIIAISSDDLGSLKKMVSEEELSFPVLSDAYFSIIDAFGVFTNRYSYQHENPQVHGEPAYFLTNEGGEVMYQQKQTGPFGRPVSSDLIRTVQYIRQK